MMRIKELVFASGNQGKTREVQRVFEPYGIKVWSGPELADARNLTRQPEVEEVGSTYRENALLKARAYLDWSGMPCLGDDSGLEVEALDGAPGLYSARYAGKGATDEENNQKLISIILGKSSIEEASRARYVSFVVLLLPDGQMIESSGFLEGHIITTPRGSGGFGYDPLFVVRNHGRTLAEFKADGIPVKTHRILAIEQLIQSSGICTRT